MQMDAEITCRCDYAQPFQLSRLSRRRGELGPLGAGFSPHSPLPLGGADLCQPELRSDCHLSWPPWPSVPFGPKGVQRPCCQCGIPQRSWLTTSWRASAGAPGCKVPTILCAHSRGQESSSACVAKPPSLGLGSPMHFWIV